MDAGFELRGSVNYMRDTEGTVIMPQMGLRAKQYLIYGDKK